MFPYQLLKDVPPKLERLRAFGYLCYSTCLIRKDKSPSLEPLEAFTLGTLPLRKVTSPMLSPPRPFKSAWMWFFMRNYFHFFKWSIPTLLPLRIPTQAMTFMPQTLMNLHHLCLRHLPLRSPPFTQVPYIPHHHSRGATFLLRPPPPSLSLLPLGLLRRRLHPHLPLQNILFGSPLDLRRDLFS